MPAPVLQLSGLDGSACYGPVLSALQQHWGSPLDVDIRRHQAQRSRQQNAYLHALPFPMIAQHVGDSVEAVKLELMGECWGWHRSKAGGHLVPVKPHTSSMSVEECSHFIDWLIPFAAQMFGLEIPLPHEEAR